MIDQNLKKIMIGCLIKMEITKSEFKIYEDCRQSGITNMLMIKHVMTLTDLSKEKILYIMENYAELRMEYSLKGGDK